MWNVLSNYYDENELIRRIQKGDESALAIIISEYHAYVGKIVYSILGSYSHKIDLQGVVNQIFFTLWHKANKIDPSKSVTIKGYLGILARNTAINEKKKCIPDYQINDEVIADISDDFNQVELRLLLANALRKLNKDEQLILVLFYFQNEKIADISRITGIPASTVKSKLKRCKEKMKKFLEEFKAFAMRGNVMDMAVGVIIGTAFGKITTSLVNDVFMPLIGLLIGGVNLGQLNIVLKPEVLDEAGQVVTEAVTLGIGTFLSTVIDFVLVAFVIFLMVKTINQLHKLGKKDEEPQEEEEPAPTSEELLTEIRDLLKEQQK